MGSGVPAKAECTGIDGWQLAVPVTSSKHVGTHNAGRLYIMLQPSAWKSSGYYTRLTLLSPAIGLSTGKHNSAFPLKC